MGDRLRRACRLRYDGLGDAERALHYVGLNGADRFDGVEDATADIDRQQNSARADVDDCLKRKGRSQAIAAFPVH